MKTYIANESIYYHIYPIGFTGAPFKNEGEKTAAKRIYKISEHIPHMKKLGINALYLGPVFESKYHGYDTTDYRNLDSRLGTNEDFEKVCKELEENDIDLILDGVFNHVGRHFFAFEDIKKNREASPYCSWISGLRFDMNNSYNDGFHYDAWQGHEELVKLNLKNEDVINYLLESVDMWIDKFGIKGLRLDAADCIDKDFFKRLRQHTTKKRPDFWLMGEIIHGDYRMWANSEMLHSVTNYEMHKGYYSGVNDKNMFEPAHGLLREYGDWGLYKDLVLYNFVDNHDINRLSSYLNSTDNLKNIYTMLFTVPGTPSIYYGSEYGIKGKKENHSDAPLRPCWDDIEITQEGKELFDYIAKLAEIRKSSKALKYGDYKQVHLESEAFAFSRSKDNETAVVAVNISGTEKNFCFNINGREIKTQLKPYDSEIIMI